MRIACLIPARGGSKGIPKKNIIDFNGKPLISYSIEQAKMSKYIDKIFVTSDSNEILDISKSYGAFPILRPEELSTDFCSSESALIDAISQIGSDYDIFVFLQATSPLRTNEDIDSCIEEFLSKSLDSLFSSCVLEDFLIWDFNDGELQSINYDYKKRKRRQDHKPQYVENGSIYVFKKDSILSSNNRLSGKVGMYVMENWKMFEIDNIEDLELCSYIFEKKILPNVSRLRH
jgi:N-acylneuraminate cytidylyltransferase